MARDLSNRPRPRILQWNCRSLRRRHAELAEHKSLHEFDILALQETYARAEDLTLHNFIGYSGPTTCALSDCSDAPCTDPGHPPGSPRTALYVRAALAHTCIPCERFCDDAVECLAVTVRVGGVDTSVACVYVRPSLRCDYAFVPRLAAALTADCIVCGDFNAHHNSWGCGLTDLRGRCLSDAIATTGLSILNTGEPTFVRRNTRPSTIDLALVSQSCSYIWTRAPDTAGSDHYPIALSPCHPSRGAKRVYSVVRWHVFRELCAKPTLASDFFTHIAECARSATTRCVVPAGSPCPDVKLLNLRAARRRAQRIATRTDRVEHWTVHNRIDAVCRRQARRLRRNSWSGVCSSLSDPRRRNRAWPIMRGLLNPRAPRHPVLAIAVARGITELELSELLADAFTPALPAPPSVSAGTLGGHRPTLSPSARTDAAVSQQLACLCDAEFTEHELARVLNRRRHRSAPGPDGITHSMLRNLNDDQRHLLLVAFNEVFNSGSLPDTWRTALVVPVLKRGKPPRSLASYRPISLTSVPGKTMEAMALHRLQWIATASGTFPPQQCGFRALRATADAIAAVVGTLEQALHDRETALLLLLDVQSAFDCLPHTTIIQAVCALGVQGKLLRYIEAFLADRSLTVRVGKANSTRRPVTTGVPQGSVLSPFLFNLALAPLTECLPKQEAFTVRAVVYADDITLYVRGPTRCLARVRKCLQNALEAVAGFLDGIGLRISAAKTEALLVHPRASERRTTRPITLHGVPLPWKTHVRYLGITIDHR